MASVVELPRLSDTMEEGVIAKWHVAVGDRVKRGQVIADIETDKATMEFESFDNGTVLRIVALEGETLPLGAPIAVLGKPDEDADAALSSHDGATAPVAAPASEVATSAAEAAPAGPAQQPAESEADATDGRIPASPVARRLAREHGLDLLAISGSGPHGRIVKSDVEAAVASGGASAGPTVVAGLPTAEADDAGRPYVGRPDERVRLSQMRKAIARNMARSNTEKPHFYLSIMVNMDAAVAMRSEYNLAVKDTKVSFNDIIVMATARALREHPRVNARFDGDGIIQIGDIHVGIAVALDEGLIVPVVRHADQKTLRAISIETRDLGKRAKVKKLRPEEMSGSTFTVSNLGMLGIHEVEAVVQPDEGAILGVGNIDDMVMVHEGQFVARKRMKLSIGCDHRVMDGADGGKFLATLKQKLEQPMALFT